MHWIRELPDPCLNSFLNFYVRRFSRFGPQYRGSPNLEAWTSWAPSVVNNYVTRSLLGRSHLCKYGTAAVVCWGAADGHPPWAHGSLHLCPQGSKFLAP